MFIFVLLQQIMVMELGNKLYHLEKSKKKVENEVKVGQQHVDHYQAKAREWKEKALKEEQAGNKVREERNQLYGELREYVAKAEELSTKLERQQFELGHQREFIQRMEKERQVGDYRPSSASLATPILPLHSSAEVRIGNILCVLLLQYNLYITNLLQSHSSLYIK